MTILVVASILFTTFLTIFLFQRIEKDYHQKRHKRKEQSIQSNINYILNESVMQLIFEHEKFQIQKRLRRIFVRRVGEIQDINNQTFHFYDLDGNHILSSINPRKRPDSISATIQQNIFDKLSNEEGYTVLTENNIRVSYSYIYDLKSKPIAILSIPYLERYSFLDENLRGFLNYLSAIHILTFIIAIALVYFISTTITKKLNSVKSEIRKGGQVVENRDIISYPYQDELKPIVDEYNKVLDKLKVLLEEKSKQERLLAWREVAKQVAHEIKNPLTPMLLLTQSFERKMMKKYPENIESIKDYTESMQQQIETLSDIASSFSDLSEVKSKIEKFSINEVIINTIQLFNKKFIFFDENTEEIYILKDKTLISRVITNLIKNSIEATNEVEQPNISIQLESLPTNLVELSIKDNGCGIPNNKIERIFEPQFTTKTSGKGLGLAIIKNIIEEYNGHISVESTPFVSTIFTIQIPIE